MSIFMKQYVFHCPCGSTHKEYIWSNELKKFKRACGCGKQITYEDLQKENKGKAPGIRTDTKNRV